MRRQISLQKKDWESRNGVFFTPPHLALRLALLVRSHLGNPPRLPPSGAWTPAIPLNNQSTNLVILDPACGNGALLRAARDLWPKARLVGFDIAPPTNAFFEFYQLNFLSQSPPSLLTFPSYTLVLVNPPWGAECAQRHPWLRGEKDSAKNFVCAALEKLRPDAMGLILPSAFLRLARHQDIRDALAQHGEIRATEDVGDGHFKGACAPAALLVWRKNEAPARTRRAATDRLATSKGPTLSDLADIVDGGLNYNRALCRALCLYHGPSQDPNDLPILRGSDVTPQGIRVASQFLRANWRAILAASSAGLPTKLHLSYSPRVLCTPRILLRQTADRPICCLDNEARPVTPLVGRSLIVLLPKPGVDPSALCAYLNSSEAAVAYQQLSGERGRPFAQVKVNLLRRLPLHRLPRL